MEIICFTTPKARKEHVCDWCNQKIQVGEIYTRAFYKEDYVYVWKNHIHCEKIAQVLNMFHDGPVTQEDFVESIKEEYQKIMRDNNNKIYGSKDFKSPSFKYQLDFVCLFHKVL